MTREITQDDMNSAMRGLGMLGKAPSELDAIAKANDQSSNFAGKVIAAAARQMAAAKRRVGHEG